MILIKLGSEVAFGCPPQHCVNLLTENLLKSCYLYQRYVLSDYDLSRGFHVFPLDYTSYSIPVWHGLRGNLAVNTHAYLGAIVLGIGKYFKRKRECKAVG